MALLASTIIIIAEGVTMAQKLLFSDEANIMKLPCGLTSACIRVVNYKPKAQFVNGTILELSGENTIIKLITLLGTVN